MSEQPLRVLVVDDDAELRQLLSTYLTRQGFDVLLLADSSWASPYWPAVDAAGAAGARIGIVQYDFIPHTHPELVPRKLPTVFRQWMKGALPRAEIGRAHV